MNLHFDNDWSKTLSPESNYWVGKHHIAHRGNYPSNYFYSAFGSSKCEKTCLEKGVEKKDESIPMSLWNQCLGNCERELDEKREKTWGTIWGYAQDVRWGDIAAGLFGKKEPAGNGGPPPPEKEGMSAGTWLFIILGILIILFLLFLVFRNKEDKK